MPVIGIVPRETAVGLRLPDWPCEIDWADPVTRGLRRCWVPPLLGAYMPELVAGDVPALSNVDGANVQPSPVGRVWMLNQGVTNESLRPTYIPGGPATQFTVIAIVRPTQNGTAKSIYGRSDPSNRSSINLILNGSNTVNNVRFSIRDDSAISLQADASVPAIWDGRWNCVGGRFMATGGTASFLHVNGFQVASASSAQFIDPALDGPPWIGGLNSNGALSQPFLGGIAAVAVWDRMLDSAEMRYVMHPARAFPFVIGAVSRFWAFPEAQPPPPPPPSVRKYRGMIVNLGKLKVG